MDRIGGSLSQAPYRGDDTTLPLAIDVRVATS